MLELDSPCKVNLVLNVLGKRPDGFHEVETLMYPVPLCDRLRIELRPEGLDLSCSDPTLAVDAANLVHRAATAFLDRTRIKTGLAIQLEKHVPIAAGLGGGSSNAATTLRGLNEIFDYPLSPVHLLEIASTLGSDVPFFLQSHPALATGRGERVETLSPFKNLTGSSFLLIHPGFGISTPWAYQELSRFPDAMHGKAGRARLLAETLGAGRLKDVGAQLYNSLEAPALEKYPILALYQEFLRGEGALGTLMSGSGSSTFALVENASFGRVLEQRFSAKFGECWTAVIPL